MIKKGLARFKLNQANFFKNCALEAISSQKRESFFHFFDATIVFARSVTFFLQKEYRYTTGFNTWYLNKVELMKQDQIFSFFLTKRNIILKVGPAEVYRIVNVTGKAKIGFSSFVELSVIRGKPWYRRSPKILLEDFRAKIMKPMRRLIWQCKIKLKNLYLQSQSRVKMTKTKITEKEFFFSDPKWKDKPACGLLQEYLNKLEQIVAEAETRFNEKSS